MGANALSAKYSTLEGWQLSKPLFFDARYTRTHKVHVLQSTVSKTHFFRPQEKKNEWLTNAHSEWSRVFVQQILLQQHEKHSKGNYLLLFSINNRKALLVSLLVSQVKHQRSLFCVSSVKTTLRKRPLSRAMNATSCTVGPVLIRAIPVRVHWLVTL